MQDKYVYGILRNSKLVYVGKGTDERVYSSMREHSGTAFFYFQTDLTDQEALELEASIIHILPGLDNVVHNRGYTYTPVRHGNPAHTSDKYKILRLLQDNPETEYSPQELAELLSIHYDTAKSGARRLLRSGLIQRTSRGRYTA